MTISISFPHSWKLFWPTLSKSYSSDREKLLKNERSEQFLKSNTIFNLLLEHVLSSQVFNLSCLNNLAKLSAYQIHLENINTYILPCMWEAVTTFLYFVCVPETGNRHSNLLRGIDICSGVTWRNTMDILKMYWLILLSFLHNSEEIPKKDDSITNILIK